MNIRQLEKADENMTIRQLEKAESAAKDAYNNLKSEVDQKRWELLAEAREAIDAKLDEEFGARLSAFVKAKSEATKALKDAEIAKAIDNAHWSIGTHLVGWARPRRYGARQLPGDVPRDGTHHQTAMVQVCEGILEVVTHDTIHPANMKYEKVGIGDYIVRLKKKDGTVGVSYEKLNSVRRPKKWLPVGEVPKEAKS